MTRYRIHYVFRDKHGSRGGGSRGFENKPLTNNKYWDDYQERSHVINIPIEFAPKSFTGKWTESLFEIK